MTKYAVAARRSLDDAPLSACDLQSPRCRDVTVSSASGRNARQLIHPPFMFPVPVSTTTMHYQLFTSNKRISGRAKATAKWRRSYRHGVARNGNEER
jgi:hypothetical protein